MTVEDDLDALYRVRPDEFTARRNEFVAAARKRGDADAAKVIAAARRPTTAAWVVNLLALTDETMRQRLTELHDELRDAHAAMDGQRIRELSAVQRRLVQELARAGFAAARQDPTPAMRDDVTATLQAAVADPDVATRLGRLSKPEEWSGFGDFGASSAVGARARSANGSVPRTSSPPSKKKPTPPDTGAIDEARRGRETAAAEVDAARAAHDDALAAVAERRREVNTARRRYEKLLETLAAAERDIETAATQLNDAEQSARALQRRLHTTEAALKQADSRLNRLAGE
ncbi:hypothetical protein [Mycolicibacterium neworleansense]|uniref:Uncharacterized protein n=1 Tax=Mycolicibacterium neworleansense TaxID=146018 RepID=A0A0H5S019_9MYCO|nr:hypothetical protein [Mycolicibacterium neworleansense]MCV7363379.1 hypothetical protein [Mycolicibacterium neworleansense]CRZ14314.1 hypothetical protein BN2156_01162 [Mycolicibacterium neworleansense]